MAKITVDEFYCKGCGLCVSSCPKHLMQLSKERINAKGYHPAECSDEEACVGCCACALMCPDVAITVER